MSVTQETLYSWLKATDPSKYCGIRQEGDAHFFERDNVGQGYELLHVNHHYRWTLGEEYRQTIELRDPQGYLKFGVDRTDPWGVCRGTYNVIYGADVTRDRDVECPDGYAPNTTTEPKYAYCYKALGPNSDKNVGCEEKQKNAGNPVNTSNGNKTQIETDYRSAILSFHRRYNSLALSTPGTEAMGRNWRHSFEYFVAAPDTIDSGDTIYAFRPDGRVLYFTYEDGAFIADPDVRDTLSAEDDGWRYLTADDRTELYDGQGRLQSISDLHGLVHTLSYDVRGRLAQVQARSGQSLHFAYDEQQPTLIATARDHTGRTWTYGYDRYLNLKSVTNPDSTTRQYLYEDTRFPQALTGILDEKGNRFATWAYDDQGRAISSEHTGEADRTTLTYNTDGTTTVTNALGRETTYHFEVIHGVHKVTRVEGHPTDTCAGSNKAYSYDTNGFLASKTDWNGNLTTYVHDARGLETSRTEAAGTPEERTITTEWHPDYRVPTRITEPGKTTELSYDADGRLLSRTERAAP